MPSELAFNGYERRLDGVPDAFITSVGRGTAGGEYQRRFWHPVALLEELAEVPLRVRALGEDLVVFRDRGGRIGALHLHCCHRNSSLEFGVVGERGLRCCYHGRLFDVDGRILEVPGDPAEEQIKARLSQGAYPVHVFAGIVFIYMGPPDRVPVFPIYDRLDLPGLRLVPGPRLPLDCNWLQIKENSMDPHHTAFLHVIPQLRGMDHFAEEFGNYPELTWAETPGGMIYLGARLVGDKVWVRSAETLGANIHCISSIFESGQVEKPANPPFLTFWTLPVDDTHSINFFLSHVAENEAMPFEKRRYLEIFGQYDDRPYNERQWIPGDHDAMVSQGPINPHDQEHLGTLDRGVVMFRRLIRRGIEAVAQGEDPQGFYLTQQDVPPSFANDCVVAATELEGNAADPVVLVRFAERLARDYLATPPMTHLR
jgi:phenylpropionate dioxygenase-like ring-hydroxylating dioxygenase large terminal subunit